MAYELRSRKGLQIKKDGNPVFAADNIEIKIEQLDEKEKSFIAVASTEHEDRDKDIVRQDGWKLANFNKNPVVPWSHNYYGIPIAKSLKTWVDKTDKKGSRLLFKPKFDQDDEESMKVFNKYKNGFLTSFSVGFQGIKFNYRNEDDPWWGGREFTEQELLEISAVAVPANPHASTRLSYAGVEKPNNLIQMGYPEVFAKTKAGLFYPVTDIAVYTDPKKVDIEKGVVGIKAVSLLDNEEISDPVAYLFDPELFSDKTVNEWISQNANKKWKTKYIDIKFTDSDMFSLSSLETEDSIKEFKSPIDLSETDLSIEIKDTEDKVSDSISDSGSENSDDVKEIGDGATDDKGSTDGIKDEISNKGDEKSEPLEDNSNLDSVEEVQDAITFPVKSFIEVVTIIKDFDGKVLDQNTSVIASNKEFKTAQEFIDNKGKDPISLLKEEVLELKKAIDTLCNEKMVANVSEISDNSDQLNDDEVKSSESPNEEIIELDESLIINSPGINEKTNSDDQIEIDDELLIKSSDDFKKVTNDSLLEKMKCNLKEALKAASGKID
jgi:HK97 family phage prohead protease